MSVLATLRDQLEPAMRAQDKRKLSILRVAIAEVERTTAPAVGRDAVEQTAIKAIKKLVQSNEETAAALPDDDARCETLLWENVFLRQFLPVEMTAEEVRERLLGMDDVLDEIKEAKSDGQATGIAMKGLKAHGVTAGGDAVKTAVTAIRAG